MRKMLSIILAAGIIFGLTATAMAVQNPDYGYVIVRCTVTLSVDVEDNATAYFSTGNEPERYVISAGLGLDYVSTSSITVKNDSVGALCIWNVQVSAIQRANSNIWESITAWNTEPYWTLGTSPDVEQAVLYAVFCSSRPSTGEFESNDILSVGSDKTWKHKSSASDVDLDPTSTTSGFQYPQNTRTSGYSNKVTAPGDRRALWFRFLPPTAVRDDNFRRFIIQITAALAE